MMKIECHVLQNFAPSCLNRDDTNTPKSCEFGGFTRARVSSQSWKRAMRDYFSQNKLVSIGIRTKQIVELIDKKLEGSIPKDEIIAFVEEYYSKMETKDKKKTEKTAVLVFTSETEIEAIAACLKEGSEPKTVLDRMNNAQMSVDVALFGRMLAENPKRNVDGACQVAHAISTHRANLETDFYTAVDDLVNASEETGAAMMGVQGYNSACYYRYAMLDVDQLMKNLQQDVKLTEDATKAFLQTFCLAVPSGKQNSMAANSLPSCVLFIARQEGVPVSLANAFVKPVTGEDITTRSMEKMIQYHDRLDSMYGLYDKAQQALVHDREEIDLGDRLAGNEFKKLDDAIDSIMTKVRGEGK